MRIFVAPIAAFLVTEVYKLIHDSEGRVRPTSEESVNPLEGLTIEFLGTASRARGSKQNTYRVVVKLDRHLTVTAIMFEHVPAGDRQSKATYEIDVCTLELVKPRSDIDTFFGKIQQHVTRKLTVVHEPVMDGIGRGSVYFEWNEAKLVAV